MIKQMIVADGLIVLEIVFNDVSVTITQALDVVAVLIDRESMNGEVKKLACVARLPGIDEFFSMSDDDADEAFLATYLDLKLARVVMDAIDRAGMSDSQEEAFDAARYGLNDEMSVEDLERELDFAGVLDRFEEVPGRSYDDDDRKLLSMARNGLRKYYKSFKLGGR